MNCGSPKVCRGVKQQSAHYLQREDFKKKRHHCKLSSLTRGNSASPLFQGIGSGPTPGVVLQELLKQQRELNGEIVFEPPLKKHIYDEEVLRACLFHPWVAGENIYHHSPLHR